MLSIWNWITKDTLAIWYKERVMLGGMSESFFLIKVRAAHINLKIVPPGQACGMLVRQEAACSTVVMLLQMRLLDWLWLLMLSFLWPCKITVRFKYLFG